MLIDKLTGSNIKFLYKKMSRHKLWVYSDKYNRELFLKNELIRLLLRSVKFNKNLNYIKRLLSSYHLTRLRVNSSESFITYRCIFSGRVWSVNRFTGLNRFVFRKKAYNSFLPGFSRASW